MDETQAVRLGQARADLPEDVDYPARRERARTS